jgi:hypothetical protein
MNRFASKVARRLKLYLDRLQYEALSPRRSRSEIQQRLGLANVSARQSWNQDVATIVNGFSPLPVLPRESASPDGAHFRIAGRRIAIPDEAKNGIDWHLEPVFNVRWPRQFVGGLSDFCDGSDLVLLWHLNKMTFLLELTNRDSPAAAGGQVYEYIDSWCRANPYRVGMNWRSPMEAGTRLVHWLTAMQRVGIDAIPDDAVSERIVRSVLRQAEFVAAATERASVPNNHLIGEAATLFTISVFCNSFSASREWRELAEATLLAEVERQILDDGFQFESSINYHAYVLDFLLLYFRAKAVANDAPAPGVLAGAVRLAETLCRVVAPSGALPQIGDDSISEFFVLRDAGTTNGVGDRVRFSDFLKPEALKSFREFEWAVPLLDVERPLQEFHQFQDAGVGVLRTADAYVLMTCGPQHSREYSHGHLHNDVGGVAVELFGEPVLIDAGTGLYTRDDELRKYFKGARAHNVLIVDGVDAMESQRTFAWKNIVSGSLEPLIRLDADSAYMSCARELPGTGGARFSHTRLVALHHNDVVIIDRLHRLNNGTVDNDVHQFEILHHTPLTGDRVVGEGTSFSLTMKRGPIGFSFWSPETMTVGRHSEAHRDSRYSSEYGVVEYGTTLITSGVVANDQPTIVISVIGSGEARVEFDGSGASIDTGHSSLRLDLETERLSLKGNYGE